MKTSGAIFSILGIFAAVYAFVGFDPTVAGGIGSFERTVNLQLLQVQTMIFHAGLAAVVAGTILYAAGAILERLGGNAEWAVPEPIGSTAGFDPNDHIG